MDSLITQQVEVYIRNLFEEKINKKFLYHNILHTEYVVGRAMEIAQHSGVNEEDVNLVAVAAWFHDSGFVVRAKGHEEESQKIAREFLASHDVNEEAILRVLGCIKATEMPQNPGDNLLAQIVCDADMAYLSEDFYLKRTNLLRKEWNQGSEKKYTRKAYYKDTIEMFQNHRFHTEYAEKEFSSGKAKNFKLLHKMLKKEDDKKAPKKPAFGRGVESMFRLTARNQINLSSIADNKANILISVNTIVLTLLLSIGIGRVSDYPSITFPAIVFLITCLSTIILAILSTRPKVSSGKFTKEDIHNKRVNLLFFGNFYNMSMDEYEWAVKELISDDDYLYTSMIRDQYSLGKVISRKYKLLRIAYNVFMFGLILSSILFAVSVIFMS
jgi:predicted metal-dependent HD superfamily phosphohydrolase